MSDLVIVPESPEEIGLPYKTYRPGQREVIQRILNAFLAGNNTVLLEGATGIGKSLIAMAVAAMLETNVAVTTQTKQLAYQYAASFPFARTIAGRDNFQCALHPELSCSEAPCTAGVQCANKHAICDYYIQKDLGVRSGCVITNIWYFIQEVNNVGQLGGRGLLVVDEGHLLESALLATVSIDLSRNQFNRVGFPLPPIMTVNDAIEVARHYYPRMYNLLASTSYSSDPKFYKRLRTETEKLNRILSLDTSKAWVVINSMYGPSLKPVWVTDFGKPMIFSHAHRTLIMSATIRDKVQFCKCLGIDHRDAVYIESPSRFPAANRPVNYWPVASIGRKATSKDYHNLVKSIDTILKIHKGQKGVIHTVSYHVRDIIMELSKFRSRLVTHGAEDREEAIEGFKLMDGDPVLISPSVEIGLDLPDDLGRFTIVAKIPFLDLGDKQVAERKAQDAAWYTWATACTLLQMLGRCVRSETDWASGYILDSNAGWFMRRNQALFPTWWKEAVYHIDSPTKIVLPPQMCN